MLSVLTLNLWHDAGPYEARVARIRDWIDRLDLDLIGFQEALRGPDFDQLAELLVGTEPLRVRTEPLAATRRPALEDSGG